MAPTSEPPRENGVSPGKVGVDVRCSNHAEEMCLPRTTERACDAIRSCGATANRRHRVRSCQLELVNCGGISVHETDHADVAAAARVRQRRRSDATEERAARQRGADELWC
jgi:hypothetical protein